MFIFDWVICYSFLLLLYFYFFEVLNIFFDVCYEGCFEKILRGFMFICI